MFFSVPCLYRYGVDLYDGELGFLFRLYTVLSKSLGFELRQFCSLFSRTFVESSLESSREISLHLERYFAETKGDTSLHFRDRNEISR